MSDRIMTPEDVFVGMGHRRLQVDLPPNIFVFLWGLIAHASFHLNPPLSDPFDLSKARALSCGGGSSMKALEKRQVDMRRVRIRNQWLVRIRQIHSTWQMPSDRYWINYELLTGGMQRPPGTIKKLYGNIRPQLKEEIRRAVLERDQNQCQICGETEKLHIHHLTYRNEGDEKMDDLITLCASCHGKQKGKNA